MIRGKNLFYILAGILYLVSCLLMVQHDLDNPLLGLFDAIIGILLIIMGFLSMKSIYIIARILGVIISLIGTFGVYYSIRHPETNSFTDLLSAGLLALCGYLTLVGASIGKSYRNRTVG